MPNPNLQKLLQSIIACLGRHTPEPVIEWDEEKAAYSIQVNIRDMGRFVGKNGINIWALRGIFWYAGLAQIQRTVDLNLLEPVNGDSRTPPFKPNTNWDRVRISTMVNNVLEFCFNGTQLNWIMNGDPNKAEAKVAIHLDKYLQTPCANPDFAEAIKTVIFAAGMADGCSIKTEITWR